MKISILSTAAIAITILVVGCSDKKILLTAPNPNFKPLPTEYVEKVGKDPLLGKQWSLQKMGMESVWAKNQGTRRVSVAILSTGVDYNHENLRGNMWVNQIEMTPKAPGALPTDGLDKDQNGYVNDFVGWDVIDHDGLPYDRVGPGTAAAGIIGATHNGPGIRGINAKVSMIPVRYIGPNGQTNVPQLILALQYAMAVNADVILIHLANIDFSSGERGASEEDAKVIQKAEADGLGAILDKLKAKDTPVIVSAGNTGADVGKTKGVIKKIASYPNAFIVTSVDAQDVRPFIANFGMSLVQTAAPGEKILTTLPGNRYGTESGTLMAAAHVAGAVSLAIGKFYGRVKTEGLFKALVSEKGSDVVAGLQYESIGGNRLNIDKFLAALDEGR